METPFLAQVDHEVVGPHKGPTVVTADSQGQTLMAPTQSSAQGSPASSPSRVPPHPEHRAGAGWGQASDRPSLREPERANLKPSSCCQAGGGCRPCRLIPGAQAPPVSLGGVH